MNKVGLTMVGGIFSGAPVPAVIATVTLEVTDEEAMKLKLAHAGDSSTVSPGTAARSPFPSASA